MKVLSILIRKMTNLKILTREKQFNLRKINQEPQIKVLLISNQLIYKIMKSNWMDKNSKSLVLKNLIKEMK